jgi:hypothetical protein
VRRSPWQEWLHGYYFALIFLLFAILISVALFANARMIGQLVAHRVQLEGDVRRAHLHLTKGQQLLVKGQFVQSQADFVQAHDILQHTRARVEEVLAPSYGVLALFDVSGRVRTVRGLLAAGEQLSAVGIRLSYALELLRTSRVTPPAAGEATQAVTLVEAIEEIRPHVLQAWHDVRAVEEHIEDVNSALLPAAVQPTWQELTQLIPQAETGLQSFLNQSDALLEVLGARRRQHYLVVFQNNYEMRPTGGFIGSIAVLTVDRGVLEKVDVQSVYDPDGQLAQFILPPEPLLRIVPRWYLRDANWFVDFRDSARKISQFLEAERGPTVDGVVAMTPEVIRQLLTVTGPIFVPYYNVEVNANNFVAVTQRLVTYEYDRELNRPKQFLADLTPLLLNRLFQDPANDAARVLQALATSIEQKHLLLYLRDPALQAQGEAFGWSGKVPDTSQGLVMVNNANIGGHKSDQFITQHIRYRAYMQSTGDVEADVTITRTHRGPIEGDPELSYSEENPAIKNNVVWQRVFVPPEAQLIASSGFTSPQDVPQLVELARDLPLAPDDDVAAWERRQVRHAHGTIVGEESGLRYFAHWMITPPGTTTVGYYRYRVPHEAELPHWWNQFSRYSMRLIKQPGDIRSTYSLELHLPDGTAVTHTTPQAQLTRGQLTPVVVRHGQLVQDVMVGAIYEKSSDVP